MAPAHSYTADVLIIGGGIVGLSLAHALRQLGISSCVFERDNSPRIQGFALSVHWCKTVFEHILGPELAARLPSTSVDPEIPQVDLNWDTIDLRDGSLMYRLPTPGQFIRSNRPKLRNLCSEGVYIRMGKIFEKYTIVPDGVIASFRGGEEYKGKFLIGCDGSASLVRDLLVGEGSGLYRLPIGSLAVIQTLSKEDVAPIRKVDNLLFQAIHPEEKTFLWHSIQSVEKETGTATMLTNVSYAIDSFDDDLPMSASNEEVIAEMGRRSSKFVEPFRSYVANIKKDSPVFRIQLRDWISRPWTGGEGRVTLAGDAAGPMTMYRGEAVNHGILDAFWLSRTISSILKGQESEANAAFKKYEATLCRRRQFSIPLSRQACLDAHGFVKPDSPLVNYYPMPTSELDDALALIQAEKNAIPAC